jgi:predicted amidohydrolase
MSTLRVLMVQPQLCWQDPAENRRQLEALVDKTLDAAEAQEKADLILLPETFTTGFLGDVNRKAESMNGDTVQWLNQVARSRDAAIGGSVVIEEDGERFNRFLLALPDGQLHAYDKRHLFAHGGEHKRYTAGHRNVVVAFRGWRISLQICYDLRFPAWCRNRDKYDLQVFVANWPAKRIAAWSALLRARAIENQACVIGINRVGEDGMGLSYPGLSAAYGPLGEEIACLGDAVDARVVVLDLEALRKVRRDLPFLQDADAFHLNK